MQGFCGAGEVSRVVRLLQRQTMGQVCGSCALIMVGGLATSLGKWRRSWLGIRTLLRAKQEPQAGSEGTCRLLCTSHLSSDVHWFCKLNNLFVFVRVISSLGRDWGKLYQKVLRSIRMFFLDPSLLYIFVRNWEKLRHRTNSMLSVHMSQCMLVDHAGTFVYWMPTIYLLAKYKMAS